MTDTAERFRRTSAWPTGVGELQGVPAGVISRLGAMVIDVLLLGALVGVMYIGVAALRFMARPRQFQWPEVSFNSLLLIAGVLAVLLLATGWAAAGRTTGMRVMGLLLIGRSRRRMRFFPALLRAFTCVVFPLGLLWSAVSRRNASVHDLLFGTQVVYRWETRVPEANR